MFAGNRILTGLIIAAGLWSASASAVINITVGMDSVAPGGTATVPIAFDCAAGETPQAAQWDITFDDTIITGTNLGNCLADMDVPGGTTNFSTCTAIGTDTVRIALLFNPPGNVCPDGNPAAGQVGSIDFDVSGAALPGMIPLTIPPGSVVVDGGLATNLVDGSITVNGPAIAFTPDPIDFGNVLTGSMNTVTVTAENVGNQTVTLDPAVLVTGTDFTVANDNCGGATLAAAATCTFDAVWTPGAAGAGAGTYSVSELIINRDQNRGGVTWSVNAVGTAFNDEPEYSSTPAPASNIDFGNVQATAGMTASMDVDITNVATPAPPIMAALDTTCTIMNDASGVFSVTAGNMTSLAPAAMGTVTVQCDPVDSQTMAYTGDLSCAHNDNDGSPANPAVYSLMCMGVFTNFGSTPGNGGNIDTGSQIAGSAVVTTNETLTLMETSGNGDINVSNVMINNTTAGFVFTVPNLDGATITSGGSMVFTPDCSVAGVSLMPGDMPVNGTADLTFMTDSDVSNPTYTLTCQALPPDPIGSTSPPSGSDIVFPSASAGNVVMQTVVVSNDAAATADLVTSNCVFGGPDAGNFAIGMIPTPLAPGASGNLDVMCRIDDDGVTYMATLTCDTNDTDFAQFTFNLICSGVPLVIPTLSQWGIPLFILTLMVAGGIMLRRRSVQH